jgi:hypothetical protein
MIEIYGSKMFTDKIKKVLENKKLNCVALMHVYLKNNIPNECSDCLYFPCDKNEPCVYNKKVGK